jgi:hypothetical protein
LSLFLCKFQQPLLVGELLLLQISNFNECFDEDLPLLFVFEHVTIADVLLGLIYFLDEDLRKFIVFLVVNAIQEGLFLTVSEML